MIKYLYLTLFISIFYSGIKAQTNNDKTYGFFSRANTILKTNPEHISKADTLKCLSLYTNAIALNPQFWQAYRNRAKLYAGLNQFKNALIDITSALKYAKQSDNSNLLVTQGVYFYELKKYANAVISLNKAIPNLGSPAYANLYMARAKWMLGLKNEACIYYQKAITDEPAYARQRGFIDCQ